MTFSEDHQVSGGISLNANVSPTPFPFRPRYHLGGTQFAPSFLDAAWEFVVLRFRVSRPMFKPREEFTQRKRKKKTVPAAFPIRYQLKVKLMHPFLGCHFQTKIP